MISVRAKINDLTLRVGLAAYKRPVTMKAFNVASSIIDPIGKRIVPNYQSGKTLRDILGHPSVYISDFSVEQVKALTPMQVRSMDTMQFLSVAYNNRSIFTKKQIQAMTPDQLELMYDLTKEQIQSLTPKQISQVRLHMIFHSGKGRTIGLLLPEQIRAISLSQIEELSEKDLVNIKPTQVWDSFTDLQIRVLAPKASKILDDIDVNYWIKEWPEMMQTVSGIISRNLLIDQ